MALVSTAMSRLRAAKPKCKIASGRYAAASASNLDSISDETTGRTASSSRILKRARRGRSFSRARTRALVGLLLAPGKAPKPVTRMQTRAPPTVAFRPDCEGVALIDTVKLACATRTRTRISDRVGCRPTSASRHPHGATEFSKTASDEGRGGSPDRHDRRDAWLRLRARRQRVPFDLVPRSQSYHSARPSPDLAESRIERIEGLTSRAMASQRAMSKST